MTWEGTEEQTQELLRKQMMMLGRGAPLARALSPMQYYRMTGRFAADGACMLPERFGGAAAEHALRDLIASLVEVHSPTRSTLNTGPVVYSRDGVPVPQTSNLAVRGTCIDITGMRASVDARALALGGMYGQQVPVHFPAFKMFVRGVSTRMHSTGRVVVVGGRRINDYVESMEVLCWMMRELFGMYVTFGYPSAQMVTMHVVCGGTVDIKRIRREHSTLCSHKKFPGLRFNKFYAKTCITLFAVGRANITGFRTEHRSYRLWAYFYKRYLSMYFVDSDTGRPVPPPVAVVIHDREFEEFDNGEEWEVGRCAWSIEEEQRAWDRGLRPQTPVKRSARASAVKLEEPGDLGAEPPLAKVIELAAENGYGAAPWFAPEPPFFGVHYYAARWLLTTDLPAEVFGSPLDEPEDPAAAEVAQYARALGECGAEIV